MHRFEARIVFIAIGLFLAGCGGSSGSRKAKPVIGDGGPDVVDVPDAPTPPPDGAVDPEDASPPPPDAPPPDAPPGTDGPLPLHRITIVRTGDGSGDVTSSESGLSCTDGADAGTCDAPIPEGADLTFTATALTGSVFDGWSGPCSGTGSCRITVTSDVTISAGFSLSRFTVGVIASGSGAGRITSSAGGLDCPGTCSSEFAYGTLVTLTAAPEASSTFVGWTGPCSGTDPCTVTVDEAKSVGAEFALLSHGLTVGSSGAGTGTVDVDPPNQPCESGSCTLEHGTSVTVHAVPDAGSQFLGWNGDACSGTSPACTFDMLGGRTVEAVFSLDDLGLTVRRTGAGAGRLTSAPAGIDCGTTCTTSFPFGTSVVVTAAPAAGSQLGAFTGCDGVTGNRCTVAIDQARQVTARFDLLSYTVTAARAGNGAGTVTSAPAGITCGADCTEPYDHGTDVVLTATPAASSTFGGWAGCDSVTGNACTIDVTSARTATATFRLRTHAVTVVPAGTGAGTVASVPAGINCGGDCTQNYNHGTDVVLTATPSTGSTFTSWTNCPSAAANVCTVDVTGATTIDATFTLNRYRLTVTRTGTGTVRSNPAGINCGGTCFADFDHGTSVRLTPTPGALFKWGSWTNCPQVMGMACIVNLTAARTVRANFVPDVSPTIVITSPANGASLNTTDYDNTSGNWYLNQLFTATVTDVEDGTLTGASVVWTTDQTSIQPATLGTGTSFTAALFAACPTSIHTITVTATDSAGNVTTATITVNVSSSC